MDLEDIKVITTDGREHIICGNLSKEDKIDFIFRYGLQKEVDNKVIVYDRSQFKQIILIEES